MPGTNSPCQYSIGWENVASKGRLSWRIRHMLAFGPAINRKTGCSHSSRPHSSPVGLVLGCWSTSSRPRSGSVGGRACRSELSHGSCLSTPSHLATPSLNSDTVSLASRSYETATGERSSVSGTVRRATDSAILRVSSTPSHSGAFTSYTPVIIPTPRSYSSTFTVRSFHSQPSMAL